MENKDMKMNAAYALNLCTVSVSQIIDYDDLNVMEQEYDAILNNLNLENMPHDEALLKILKQILDTITFFRIQEGDRRIMDMKYRQKMRNAIWSAAPNFGLIVAGGNPVTMAISLASQVGIGYMNYRKTKAENNLDYKEQQWKLQRTAIEQLNGLQRELLDTAWRLADAYGFEDELRLSEKQIKHYDSILMDDNAMRKFDRLEAVKSYFGAYPPFWYFIGNTANEIARDKALDISDDTKAYYGDKAKEYFAKFWETNRFPLLREDQLASACALEYADILLDDGNNQEQVLDLIDKAVKFAGNTWDVLQLCAIGYLRAGANEKAMPILNSLVNEKYNSSVNAQLLSAILINEYTNKNNSIAKSQYESLMHRVNNTNHLIPWPNGDNSSELDFYENQREMSSRRYRLMLKNYEDKYVNIFNRIIPIPQDELDRVGADYSASRQEERMNAIEHILKSPRREAFLGEINDINFGLELIDSINHMLASLSKLKVISNVDHIAEVISNTISSKSKDIEKIQEKMRSFSFTESDYVLLQKIVNDELLKEAFDEAKNQAESSISKMNDMGELSQATTELADFCQDEEIALPGSREDIIGDIVANPAKPLYVSPKVLGEKEEYFSKIMAQKEVMTGIIKQKIEGALSGNPNIIVIYPGSDAFNEYFSKCDKNVKDYNNEVLAILDDRALLFDTDLLFTTFGILIVERNSLKEICLYDSIEHDSKSGKFIFGNTTFRNNNIDALKLNAALTELKQAGNRR